MPEINRPSDNMTADELFAMDFECPDCGKKARFGPEYMVGKLLVHDAFDLDPSCVGCQRVMEARGASWNIDKQ